VALRASWYRRNHIFVPPGLPLRDEDGPARGHPPLRVDKRRLGFTFRCRSMTATSEIIHIPLNKLVPSPFNVRKAGGQSLEELSASIRAHGLLHNLVVAEQAGSGKNGSQTFQVIAGGRRYAALVKLAKEKAIPKTFPVPCRVIESAVMAETSLAENVVREAMHPADQFEAFRALIDRGAGIEEIAARFGITPAVVRQRLRLANVSPTLLALYRSDQITLEQLMALAITDDHAAQERIWNAAPPALREPQALRAALTESKVDAATDGRIRFIGIEAYTAAGGHIERDLFQPEHEGYLTDPALLDRLVAEKLEALGNAVRAEGWKWVEVYSRFDASQLATFGRLYPVATVLAPEVNVQIEALEAEREQIREGYPWADDYPQAVKARLSEIEKRIDQLSGRKEGYRPEAKASAGAIVALRNGEPFVYRGLVRTEDKRTAEAAKSDLQAGSNDADGGSQAGLPGVVVEELTAHRTAALRATLAGCPDVALLAVVHRLALELCYDGPSGGLPSALTLDPGKGTDRLDRHAKGIEESPAGIALREQYARWRSRLPEAPEGLWDWLVAQDQSVILQLLAFCASQTVDAVRLSHGAPDRARLAAADRLAQAVDLDMADWWKPASTGFLSRLTKDQILAVLTEVTGTADMAELKRLRKKDLLGEAERRLGSARWLPEPLRSSRP
jgi:ParB family chromosome partitioning protein